MEKRRSQKPFCCCQYFLKGFRTKFVKNALDENIHDLV